MSAPLALLAAMVLLLALLAALAYRQGRRMTRRTLPTAMLDELAQHKLCCLGEPAERVALELRLLFGADRAPRVPCRPGAKAG